MARLRPTNTDLLLTLQALSKPYFTVADLQKLIGLSGKSLLVTLRRLVDSGVLGRLRRNTYILAGGALDAERVAGNLHYPAYLSFESALARHGLLSQIPHTLTFATTRPSKKMLVGNTEAEFSHLQLALYFGFTDIDGLEVADLEKALLDQLYFVSRGLRQVNLAELDLRSVDGQKLVQYATAFPSSVNKMVMNSLLPLLHSTPITNENAERIVW